MGQSPHWEGCTPCAIPLVSRLAVFRPSAGYKAALLNCILILNPSYGIILWRLTQSILSYFHNHAGHFAPFGRPWLPYSFPRNWRINHASFRSPAHVPEHQFRGHHLSPDDSHHSGQPGDHPQRHHLRHRRPVLSSSVAWSMR